MKLDITTFLSRGLRPALQGGVNGGDILFSGFGLDQIGGKVEHLLKVFAGFRAFSNCSTAFR